ncbi:hypothetical protein PENSPDRAFT_610193 [Peniophora sp. CONT]|nr:hypothetical protein PENSPDRAFT_610193 [Peniophora sp. CONT]
MSLMSSDEEDQHGRGVGTSVPGKKRRLRANLACDMCRKRKSACDGKEANSGKCLNCTDHGWACTFIKTPSKKYAPGYVEALETKVKKLQSLIHRMLPGQDFTQEVGFELTHENWMLPGVCGAPEPEHPSAFVIGHTSVTPDAAASNTLSMVSLDRGNVSTPMPDDQHSSDDDRRDLTVKLHPLRGDSHWDPREYDLASYLGKASPTGLFKTAFEMRRELVPDDISSAIRHTKFWKRPAWLDRFMHDVPFKPLNFPDHDLMDELIGRYFSDINILMPVLHRPTFEEGMRSSLHLRDRMFGSLVLLVCALGSRFSDDPRVLVAGDNTWLSAGWKWFTQTRAFDDATLVTPSSQLHLLQVMCLATLYASHVSQTHAWMYTGAGIRFALDLGAHKRRAYNTKPTLEDEMYKRAFWAFIYLDRTMSSTMGRPSGIQEEDFDLEMPRCCDDEYLTHEDPELTAMQPSDKPSLLSYFIWTLKLTQIQGLALRTLYASTKAKAHYNFQGETWLTATVAHFDSLLNNWVDSVPEHLRWDPTRADDTFFSQSAHLYIQYYTTQIMVHRPFISADLRTPIPFPSLAICMNAARSLTRLTEALYKKNRDQFSILTWTAVNAGVVTLIALGHSRLGHVKLDHTLAMANVESLLFILRAREDRWRWAGRQADVLESLKAIGEVPAEGAQTAVKLKRPSGEDGPAASVNWFNTMSESTVASASPATADNQPLNIDWDAPSILYHDTHHESERDGLDYAQYGQLPQSTGTVLGNIDFDALFGLGDSSSEGTRPWSPSTNPLPGNGEGLGFGSAEAWSGIPFDLGMEDQWQWMAPPQQNMSDPGEPRP